MTIPTDEEIDALLTALDHRSACRPRYTFWSDLDGQAASLIRSLRQQLAAKVSLGDGPAALPVGPAWQREALRETIINVIRARHCSAIDPYRHIQGFLHGNVHSVQDLEREPGNQELWSMETDDYVFGHTLMLGVIATTKATRSADEILASLPQAADAKAEGSAEGASVPNSTSG